MLRILKNNRDKELISWQEYIDKRRQILDRLYPSGWHSDIVQKMSCSSLGAICSEMLTAFNTRKQPGRFFTLACRFRKTSFRPACCSS